MRIENEMKKKKVEMDKIPKNKTIPKMINQKEVKKEKISKMLKEDSKFKEVYDFARKKKGMQN